MAKTIDTSLAVSLVDSDTSTNMRLMNRLVSVVMTSYEQGTMILLASAADQEIANTGFKQLIIISSEPISIKVGSSTATAMTNATFFVLDSSDSSSLFLTNTSGSDSTIEFVFAS